MPKHWNCLIRLVNLLDLVRVEKSDRIPLHAAIAQQQGVLLVRIIVLQLYFLVVHILGAQITLLALRLENALAADQLHLRVLMRHWLVQQL